MTFLRATGQTIVLLRGSIDLSIGGMISFGSDRGDQFGDSWTTATAGAGVVAIGLLVGMANGLIISVLRLQHLP
jgi:ribose transport system permease protein